MLYIYQIFTSLPWNLHKYTNKDIRNKLLDSKKNTWILSVKSVQHHILKLQNCQIIPRSQLDILTHT